LTVLDKQARGAFRPPRSVAVTERIGYSVRIFVPQGEPEGLRLVEKSNWVGVGLVFPRGLFAEAKKRPEVNRTGVYILWGESETGSLPKVYVGEGDTVIGRLDQHNRNKDFWTHGVVFTSKDQALNKAHVQHLEARLIALAATAKRCELSRSQKVFSHLLIAQARSSMKGRPPESVGRAG
jgi:hypothetical protein